MMIHPSDTVTVDFETFAKHRDLDQTIGHAPEKKIGPLRFKDLRGFKGATFEADRNWKEIPGDDGCVVEDANGVPLIIHITKVFTQSEIHVSSLQ
jgi:hypothetical protein